MGGSQEMPTKSNHDRNQHRKEEPSPPVVRIAVTQSYGVFSD